MTSEKLEIDVYSDIHLDSWLSAYHENQIVFAPSEGVSVAFFAGDAGNGLEWTYGVIKLLSEHYDEVLTVNGNHDYYCHKEWKSNPFVDLEEYDPSNAVYDVHGWKVLTSTLWTNFRGLRSNQTLYEKSLSDFVRIPGMTFDLMIDLHERAIEHLCANAGQVDMVVTHFPPVLASQHPKYAGDALNPYFVNDLGMDFVQEIGAQIWVHGHTHSRFDYMFGGTNIVSNPIGYYGENQKVPAFIPKKVVLEP